LIALSETFQKPLTDSNLLKDVKKIEKSFEDGKIIQLNAKVGIQSSMFLVIIATHQSPLNMKMLMTAKH